MLQTRQTMATDLDMAGMESLRFVSSSVTIIGLCPASGEAVFGMRACPADGWYPGCTGLQERGDALGDARGEDGGCFLVTMGEQRA